MSVVDWVIVMAYVIAAFGVGMFFTKRASGSAEDFFVAGRSLTWFVAGTSMVATTFSSDTPLFVAGAAREGGIYTNWIWWAAAPAALATVFFFAHLWHRSGAITEIEFISLRYDKGRTVAGLRILRAVNDGLFNNSIIMASVTLAMTKIIAVILDLPTEPLFVIGGLLEVTPNLIVLSVLGVFAVIYTAMSGLYGVVYTDLIQFIMAMVGSIALAVFAYVDLSQGAGFIANLEAAPGFTDATARMLPSFENLDLEVWTFLILITFSWIGMTPGSGHFVQRILATRSEKDAMLSIYWYAFTNYVLRSWPWIIVGVASLVYFPELADPEQSYPEMIDRFLPIGLKGIMVASLLAAFMSTLDTHMNWGSSYLINDIYRPYLARQKSARHYVAASRICMLLLAIIAIGVGTQITSILAVYKFLSVMAAGNAFLVIARWYWWRITIWSEITSLISSFVVGVSLFYILPGDDFFAVQLLANTLVTTGVCLSVTLITSRNGPTTQTEAFYRKMQIHGCGWKLLKDKTGVKAISADLKSNFIAWSASIILLYSVLFGVGQLLFHNWLSAFVFGLFALASGWVVNSKLGAIIGQLRQN